MKHIIHFSFLLMFSHFLIGQDQPAVLGGTIGKYPIIMELNIYDTTCDIRYFYINQRKDIKLTGAVTQANDIIVSSDDRGDKGITKENLRLKKTTNGYGGTWSSGNKKFNVILKEITADNYKSQYEDLPGVEELKKEEPYNFIRISGLVLVKKADSINSNLEWYKEKYSGIIMPQLKKGYPAGVIKKINSYLLEKHLTEGSNYLECSGEPYGEYELDVDHVFTDKNVFSIDISVSYDCGGAHPDFGSEGLNFNGLTGELLKLDEIFWFNKSKPPHEDSDLWYEYRDSIFAPKIVELLKKIYPDEMKKPKESDEEQCDYTDTEVWNFPNWHFTSNGLYLGAIFARAARGCDSPEWSVIPYKFLKEYQSPETKFILPEQSQ